MFRKYHRSHKNSSKYWKFIILLWIFKISLIKQANCAETFIQIPDDPLDSNVGKYRLDYSPPQGNPVPNNTFFPGEVRTGVSITRLIPGTNYEFRLYYSNSTVQEVLSWQRLITTEPDSPTNLSVTVRNGINAKVSWLPPAVGGYTYFKLKLISLSEDKDSVVWMTVDRNQSLPFVLKDLTPGASYELQLYTTFEVKDSSGYVSQNFTTRPNSPGRFIVWYRNGTTMLVLWQPPYPSGIYSHYRVSIDPPDAVKSVTTVPINEDPPGPAQASFNGLVPGRAYNITVETVSNDQVSIAKTAEYHTIPPFPRNVTFDPKNVTSDSFTVQWLAPFGIGEYDSYRISIDGHSKSREIEIKANALKRVTFNQYLLPGHTYKVLVKTVSGNVPSWPTSKNVTTRPLPVILQDVLQNLNTGEVEVSWFVADESKQDQFKVVYQEVGVYSGDSRTSITPEFFTSTTLNPGRNYSVSVYAISQEMESKPATRYIITRPASPIIEDIQRVEQGLNFSWKSDVTSLQDEFLVVFTRNDTGESQFINTTKPKVHLENLLPGVSYVIKVYAISHGLKSEPHTYFHSVNPNPIRNLTIIDANKGTVTLNWLAPVNSLYQYFIVKYKTFEMKEWKENPPTNNTGITVTDLVPGENYIIAVWSVISNSVYSLYSEQVDYAVPPNSVQGVIPIQDAREITFEWPRPEGRIDYYTITWYKTDEPEPTFSEDIPGNQATEGIERKLSVLVEELFPGESYDFEIFTTAHEIKSDPFRITTRTRPIITSTLTIVNIIEQTTNFTVRFTTTPQEVSKFDFYRFKISDDSIPMQEISANSTGYRKVIFSNLVPGRLYYITAWTVSANVTSHPLKRQERLYPEAVKDINATEITDTSITLAWNKPRGEYDSFQVQYLNAENQLSINETRDYTITIYNLRPHRNFTFTVHTISGSLESGLMRQSLPVSSTFTTREGAPGQVQNFEAAETFPNSVNFRWTISPNEKNGILIGYKISYQLKGSPISEVKNFEPTDRKGTIDNLEPGKEYLFEIQAQNKIGYGNIKKLQIKMPIEAPPKPSHQVFPTEKAKTATTIVIRYRKNYFSNEHGRVMGYAVIVGEDVNKDSSALEMASWKDVQKFVAWPPYQATEIYYPFNGSTFEDFTIGAESNCATKKDYCNGPLKPGTIYRVKIRAFTAPNKFSDTYYSLPIETDAAPNTVGIVFGILALIIVLLVVVFGVFHYRRALCRSLHERNATIAHGEDIPLPNNIFIETSRPCKLEEFPEHYRFMAADSDYRFTDEYDALNNIGRGLPTTAAELPVNRPKNRFTNILPYDHSRVYLHPTDDEEGSDYINANYVPGYNSPREFVVTQGPLASTRDDFWRMCWETNSVAIVMLTRTFEKGREKCDHYWPVDTYPVMYGEIEVTVMNESHFQDWNISEFRMRKAERLRIIYHFHFTTWPDFGVPDPPQTLVRFVRAYRERIQPDMKPVVVHCSAGVGRSGTFIALDRILASMRHSDYVDIFGIVCEMRNERVNMVQNELQYICIHQCLLAVLEGRENDRAPIEVHDNQGYDDDEGIVELGD